MSRLLALALLLGGGPLVAGSPTAPLDPAQAVALADANKGGQAGRFEMTVASVGKVGGTVFLNSSADYRAPDDLSFRLKPNVVKALERRLGGSIAGDALVGKRIVVAGTLRRQMIVNERLSLRSNESLRAESFNRWQHVVPILFEHQIVSLD